MKEENLFTQSNENGNKKKNKTELKEDNLIMNDDIKNFNKSNLRPDKTFGIASCGDVMLNKMEVEIINTPAFQRLRKIKQLGSTYLVYPSATHTRFEHSLGVLKYADIIINKIRKNKHSKEEEKNIETYEEQIIRLLALLHDIGHMPFGHTIEDEFGLYLSHDKHPARWEYFVGENSDIGKIIIKYNSKTFFNRFFKLIQCEKDFKDMEQDAFMYDIVSNTVCADLIDYLNRDCLFTNLQFRFHPRFLDYFFIKNVKNKASNKEERRIAIRIYKKGKKEIRHDVISELIQLLRYRYYLGERVYYHHTKIKTGTMLAGAVIRAREADSFNEILTNNVFQDANLFNIHTMGDDELVNYLRSISPKGKSPDNIKLIKSVNKLAKKFDERELYEEIIYKTKEDLKISDEYDVKLILEEDFDKVKNKLTLRLYNNLIKKGSCVQRLEIEDLICKYLPDMESGDLLIYCPPFNMAMKLAKMKVVNQDEVVFELKDFNDDTIRKECDSIIKKHQNLWALRVFVNPKFINKYHPEYSNTYLKYKDLILQYLDWQIFSQDESEEKSNAKKFWESFVRFRLHKIGDSQKGLTIEIDNKVEELSEELSSHTKTSNKTFRELEEIDLLIKTKFNL